MKLGPDIHLPSTFRLEKNEDVSEWTGGGRIQKTTKTWHQTNNISPP